MQKFGGGGFEGLGGGRERVERRKSWVGNKKSGRMGEGEGEEEVTMRIGVWRKGLEGGGRRRRGLGRWVKDVGGRASDYSEEVMPTASTCFLTTSGINKLAIFDSHPPHPPSPHSLI